MTATFDLLEAVTNFSRLIPRVMDGETIVITQAGEPAAVLSPYKTVPENRTAGLSAGRILVHDDFDDPLPEFDL